MKFRNMMLKYYNEAGADGADGGGTSAGAGEGGEGGEGGGTGAGAGAGEGGTADWRSALPDDIRNSDSLKSVKDVPSLAKQFMDLQSHLGNSIRIPSEHASEQDRKAFYEKLTKHVPNLIPRPDPNDAEGMNALYAALGRPDDKANYEVPEVPDQINGALPEERINFLRDVAHKYGLTRDQFKGVVTEVMAADAKVYEQSASSLAESRNALQREWGAAFEERSAAATKMAEITGAPPQLIEAIKSGAVNGDSLKWLYNLSSRMSGTGASAVNDQGSGKMTPAEAQHRIDEIMNNRSHPYWDSHHPDNKRAINTVIELTRFASAGND